MRTVTLASGESATGRVLKLEPAFIASIRIQDASKTLTRSTKDGRNPDLRLGVWGPGGLYYPAHAVRSAAIPGNLAEDGITNFQFQLGVPRDTLLKLHVASRDLQLGDAAGVPLTANFSEQSFQSSGEDSQAKSFTFSVLGTLP